MKSKPPTTTRQKSPTTKLLHGILALNIFALISHVGVAAPFVEESFDYADGTSIFGLAGGTGFGSTASRTWSFTNPNPEGERDEISVPGLSYSGLASSGGALLSTAPGAATSSQNLRRFTTTPAADGSVFWASFLMRLDTTSANQYGYLFLAPNSTSANIVQIGLLPGQTRLGLGAPAKPTVLSDTELATQTTYFLAVKIEFVHPSDPLAVDPSVAAYNERVTLFVNPTPGSQAPLDSTGFTSTDYNIVTGEFSQLQFLAVLTGASGAEWLFDEIRIGTTFADVAPVPEPTVLGLAGLSLFVMFFRKRVARR